MRCCFQSRAGRGRPWQQPCPCAVSSQDHSIQPNLFAFPKTLRLKQHWLIHDTNANWNTSISRSRRYHLIQLWGSWCRISLPVHWQLCLSKRREAENNFPAASPVCWAPMYISALHIWSEPKLLRIIFTDMLFKSLPKNWNFPLPLLLTLFFCCIYTWN